MILLDIFSEELQTLPVQSYLQRLIEKRSPNASGQELQPNAGKNRTFSFDLCVAFQHEHHTHANIDVYEKD